MSGLDGETRLWIDVEATRRNVVRRVRMEQRCQELDLVATDAELELAAAVGADVVRRAVVVRGEQPLDRAEARRLHVDGPRRPAQRLDVADRVDHRVPGDALVMRLEHRLGLGRQRGILEPGVGEPGDDPLVELGVGHRVDASFRGTGP